MPVNLRTSARTSALGKAAADLVERRLDELEGGSSFSADELDTIWCHVLPERAPPPLATGRRLLTPGMLDAIEAVVRAARKRPDFAVSFDDWRYLCDTVLPERYAEPHAVAEPSPHAPGTPQKIHDLRARYLCQRCLWHDLDADAQARYDALIAAMARKPKPPHKPRKRCRYQRQDAPGQATIDFPGIRERAARGGHLVLTLVGACG